MRMLWDLARVTATTALVLLAGTTLWIAGRAAYDAALPALREGVRQLDDVERRLAANAAELAEVERNVGRLASQVRALEAAPPPWYDVAGRLRHGARVSAARAALATEEGVRRSLADTRGWLETTAERLRSTWPQRVLRFVRRHAWTGLWITVAVIAAPFLFRTVWYYLVAPLAVGAVPLRLAGDLPGTVEVSPATRRLALDMDPGERLLVQSSWLKEYDAAAATKRTQFIWRLDAPFISYAAGLVELTRVEAREAGARVALWGGTDPDSHIATVTLVEHPGIVFRPRNLVALVDRPGGLRLVRRWRLGSLHAWCTLQLRYILLAGTGRVVFQGPGGIEAAVPAGDRRGVSPESVAGFDARLAYAVRRNETFWPYLRGREPLFDDLFAGPYCYLVSVAAASGGGPRAESAWSALWEIVGRILGF